MSKKYESVGIIIICKNTNKFLLLHRVNYPLTWSALAGGIEENENDPYKTIKREIFEEIRISPTMIDGIKKVGETNTMGHKHHVMVGFVDNEFDIPDLKLDENDDYGWYDINSIPKPIHPGFYESYRYVKPYIEMNEVIKNITNKLLNG
jgi:8-oxo-dGTP pyrophosphatase MutT (NUDIX family)